MNAPLSETTPLLKVAELSVDALVRTTRGTASYPLLKEVNLTVEKQRVLALLGESGCGKSMSALAIMGLLPAGVRRREGRLFFEGQDLDVLLATAPQKVRGRGLAMIFQEPVATLNPLLSIGAQLAEVLWCHLRKKGAEGKEAAYALLEAVKIPDPPRVYAQYPFQLSGGMRQRVLIALSLAAWPALIIADELTTALDVTTQAQILELFLELKEERRVSFIFITHDLGVAAELADRTAVMYAGRVVEECSVATLFDQPLHPYTQALLASRARRSIDSKKPLRTIPGAVPEPFAPEQGCAFAPRCMQRFERCDQAPPPAFILPRADAEEEHLVRCWRYAP